MLHIEGESSGTTSIINRRKSRSRTDSSFSSVLRKRSTRWERESTPIVRKLSTPSHAFHTVVMVLLSVFMPSTPSIARAFRAGTSTTAFGYRFSHQTLSFGSPSVTRSVFTSIARRGSEVEHRARSRFFFSSSSSSSGTTAINVQTTPTPSSFSDEVPPKRKKKKKKKGASKDLRREFIGKAKAVDRGQWSAVYNPGGDDGVSFEAKSGLPDRSKLFTVLGIESSCDDTGAAVVRSDGVILGESLASQTEIHESFGGVVPNLAREAHLNTIDSVVSEALANAGLSSVAEVDGIGVTVGPGLEICLRVGCEKAKGLAMEYDLPFVAVHHLEAHIMMARLPFGEGVGGEGYTALDDGGGGDLGTERAVEFPFLALLVSGGHCQLLKCLGVGRYEIIGGTIDDSLGEAYDKIARLLSLPIGGGGGPAVESLALEGDPTSIPLPIPLQKRRDCDFSYAGLKTAVRTRAEKLRIERGLESTADLGREDRANIAASFQNAAITHIEQRLKRAMDGLEKEGTGIRCLAVVGGVAANKELRGRLGRVCEGREEPWRMVVPPARLCTDQGSMSAWAAIERLCVGSSDVAEGQEVFARFPFKSNE